jgi:hypothetical protein
MTPVTPSSVCDMQGESLPEPAFRLTWRDGTYRVSKPGIDACDCYTADQMRELAQSADHWNAMACREQQAAGEYLFEIERLRAALAERTQQEALTDEQIIAVAYKTLSRWDADTIQFARAVLALRPTSAANSTAPMQPSEIPPLLFDSYAVFKALDLDGQRRTSAENVADTLDAVVHLLRVTPASTQALMQPTPGFVLVPIIPNRDMDRIMQADDWQWADVLAAAGTATEAEIAAAPMQPSVTDWQKLCTEKHGFQYVRASDDHWVECTQAQAIDMLRDVLGVDVQIVAPTQAAGGEALAEVDDLLRGCHKNHAGDSYHKARIEKARESLAAAPAAAVEPRTTPLCRDCADFGPICPSSGEPCDKRAAAAPEGLTDRIDTIIRDIAELEGSDSGPDYMVVTADELRVILERNLATPDAKTAEARRP